MPSENKPSKGLIQLVQVPSWNDPRGNLFVFEKDLPPFEIKRVYYLTNTVKNFARGFHAHRNLKQVAVAVSGKCRMVLDDGTQRQDVWLDSPSKALLIEAMTWREMHDFSPDCVLLVLANAEYDESDYIRDYETFLQEAKTAQEVKASQEEKVV